jgi:secreted trypsin-like serine protease
MRKLAIAVVAALSLGIGAAPAKAIVYGEEVIDASVSYPWVASIWYASPSDDYYRHVCTGSLILPDVVLTAAHCISNSGTYFVQMGSDTLDGNNEPAFYEVDAVWKNPRYSKKTAINDVGLLKLTNTQTTVTPMPYAAKRDLAAVKRTKKFEILGWGINQAGEDATYLRYTQVTEKGQAARAYYSSRYFNQTTMIAAGRYLRKEKIYTGACSGDSGGPLLADIKGVKKVIGITSYGGRSCNTKAPTVFSNVAYYDKDITKGIATLRRSAFVDNRAMPSIIGEPSISLEAGTLTCNPGAWSTNTKKVDIIWSAPYSIWKSTNPSVKLPSTTYSDTKYTCIVAGTNQNGQIAREVSFTVPAAPSSYIGPTIESGILSLTPNLNSTLTCSPPNWQTTGVTNAFAWYVSTSAFFDSATATLLGEGNSLVMSEAVEAAMAGKNYLHCFVVGSNAGGVARTSDYVYVYRPFKR